MALMKVRSGNTERSTDDFIRDLTENFYQSTISAMFPAIKEFANKVRDGEIECEEEEFCKYLKLTPCSQTSAQKESAGGKSRTTNGRNASKTKEITDAQKQMYGKICEDKWEWNWSEDRCQRFITTGKEVNKFCGGRVAQGNNYCAKCTSMPSQNKWILQFENEELTPESWFEMQTSKAKKTAIEKLHYEEGETVTNVPPKKVSRTPPASRTPINTRAPSNSANLITKRIYMGKDKPSDEQLFWSLHANKGYVFDSENNLIGMCHANSRQATMEDATEEDHERFGKFICQNDSGKKPTARTLVKPPVKPTVEVELSDEEEIDDEDDDEEHY